MPVSRFRISHRKAPSPVYRIVADRGGAGNPTVEDKCVTRSEMERIMRLRKSTHDRVRVFVGAFLITGWQRDADA